MQNKQSAVPNKNVLWEPKASNEKPNKTVEFIECPCSVPISNGQCHISFQFANYF